MSATITSTIDIDAPPAQVWRVLTDLPNYGTWNPFIRESSGELAVGARLTNKLHPSSGRPITFRPTVLVADEDRELRWIGRLIMPGVFDGERSFTLTPLDGGGTRLVQSETFRGVLVPFAGRMIAGTEQDFALLNDAMKRHVEMLADVG